MQLVRQLIHIAQGLIIGSAQHVYLFGHAVIGFTRRREIAQCACAFFNRLTENFQFGGASRPECPQSPGGWLR